MKQYIVPAVELDLRALNVAGPNDWPESEHQPRAPTAFGADVSRAAGLIEHQIVSAVELKLCTLDVARRNDRPESPSLAWSPRVVNLDR